VNSSSKQTTEIYACSFNTPARINETSLSVALGIWNGTRCNRCSPNHLPEQCNNNKNDLKHQTANNPENSCKPTLSKHYTDLSN